MRKSIGKKLRFEVLKRDDFKCRYCGRAQADGVVIHVDHVIPVAAGGRNDPENLVTSCADCNLGKSARMIGDPAIVGVDFAKAGKIFKEAQKSLKNYRAYLKQRELWEYDLATVVLEPMRPIYDCYPSFLVCEGAHWWAFDRDWRAKPSDLPPRDRDDPRELAWVTNNTNDAQEAVRKSTIDFVERLGPDAVRKCAEITYAKYVRSWDDNNDGMEAEAAFRYFCGVCLNQIRGTVGVAK